MGHGRVNFLAVCPLKGEKWLTCSTHHEEAQMSPQKLQAFLSAVIGLHPAMGRVSVHPSFAWSLVVVELQCWWLCPSMPSSGLQEVTHLVPEVHNMGTGLTSAHWHPCADVYGRCWESHGQCQSGIGPLWRHLMEIYTVNPHTWKGFQTFFGPRGELAKSRFMVKEKKLTLPRQCAFFFYCI